MFENSYVVAIVVFIILVIVFYIFEIGYTSTLEYTGEPNCLKAGTCTTTKIIKRFSWKYPLAIALMIWLVWHFYLFPPQEIREMSIKTPAYSPKRKDIPQVLVLPSTEATCQKINMVNWN